jgi:hypothetical protein
LRQREGWGGMGIAMKRCYCSPTHLIVHPNPKAPTRYPRLGNLKNSGGDLPTLSDERIVHLDPFRRERFSPNSPYASDRPIFCSHHRTSSTAYA